MSITISNERDLAAYLKILAEESAKESYKLLEQDPLFGDEEEGAEDEQEPEAAAGDEEDVDLDFGSDEETPEDEPTEEPDEKEQATIRPVPLTLELGEVSPDGLIATLNMIRSGRSFKDPDIASQLRKYFEDQINDSERLALATFLSAIHDLVSGTPAEDAPEPGDENINISATDKERQEAQPQHKPQTNQQSSPVGQMKAKQQRYSGVEDITSPVKVGERDEEFYESYRENILKILHS